MDENFLQQTLRLLRETDASPQAISRETGLKLRWLHRLKAGDFEDPGVTKIERLYRYLYGRAPAFDRDRPTADALDSTDAGNQIPAATAGDGQPTVEGEAA